MSVLVQNAQGSHSPEHQSSADDMTCHKNRTFAGLFQPTLTAAFSILMTACVTRMCILQHRKFHLSTAFSYSEEELFLKLFPPVQVSLVKFVIWCGIALAWNSRS